MTFDPNEERTITQTIRDAERFTTGEIRVFVEPICERDHPVERAEEVFRLHGMFHTANRNGVLLYMAPLSRQFAIWGDSGIHEKVGNQFWEAEKKLLRTYLQRDEPAAGICAVVTQIGAQLQAHFPADPNDTNPNELPDDIIYG
jgi:uncharacterized membrane protein